MNKYSIGIDIGTNSVGWAVINDNNELVRYKKKNMWGVRLFDEADKADARRAFRSARRRLKRRKQRINFLQNIMAPMVLPKDEAFFIKINESILHSDDKTKDPLSLSLKDAGYYDKDKYDKLLYPTIYHLRKELLINQEQKDPRLVYLAIHHIIKYRGNFIYQGQTFSINGGKNIFSDFEHAFELLEQETGISAIILNAQKDAIAKILQETHQSRSLRKDKIINLFEHLSKEQKEILKVFFGAIIGLTAQFKKIFTHLDEELKIEFDRIDYQEKRSEYESILGDKIDFIDTLQKIYSWVKLQDILNSQATLSDAMIAKYDEYAKDLKFIKKFFKQNLTKREYKTFFKSQTNPQGETEYYNKYSNFGWNRDNFYKILKEYYDKAKENASKEQLHSKELLRFEQRLTDKKAFTKLRISDNGAIPYQLHKNELVKIIENQGRFYPELLEKVDNGDGKNEYKIVRLLEHKIPYYIGPLTNENQQNSNFTWMKRQEKGNITPFNFYKKIDKIASAETFINNLTNNCTYLINETVLPKHSLLFSEFVVRNEIKNIRINDYPIDINLENKIIEELFYKSKTVTKKGLINYLKHNHSPLIDKQTEITGLSDAAKFNSSLSSYIDFVDKVGIKIDLNNTDSENYKMVENLIKWITIFEDKNILLEKIRLEYGQQLSNEQIQKIMKLNYSGWASLSRKLLLEVKDETNQSIINLMRIDENNFMQIISREPFKSKLQVEMENALDDKKNTYEDLLGDTWLSPGIKRGIWQSKLLIDEIIELNSDKQLGKIYLEVARGAGQQQATKARKKQIEDIYKNIQTDSVYYTKEDQSRLKNELDTFKNIDSEALFLYFKQLGKCAYSGQTLTLESLSQTCDIDHIIPRSLVKDDSIDNKVLVIKKYNAYKTNNYPLDREVVKKQSAIWKFWLDKKLISLKKFANLTKTKEKFESENVAGQFIKRQLVETRQICKYVENMFNKIYKNDDQISIVETVKAGIVSDFRDKFNFPKNRSINDFHHAKDAYLNAVLGKFLLTKFPERKSKTLYYRYMKNKNRQERDKKELNFVLYGINYDKINFETGEILDDGSTRINTITKTMAYNDCLVTKKAQIDLNGAMYNSTVYKKLNKAKSKIERKSTLSVDKYGGHTGSQIAYMAAVETINNKNKTKRYLEGIPMRIALLANHNTEKICELMRKENHEKSFKIIKNQIPKNQIIQTNDKSMLILSSQSEAGNWKQLKLPYEIELEYSNLCNIIKKYNSLNNEKAIKNLYSKLPKYVNRKNNNDGSYTYNLVENANELANDFLNDFYNLLLKKIKQEMRNPYYTNTMITKLDNFNDVFRNNQDLIAKIDFLEQALVLFHQGTPQPKFEALDITKKYFKSQTGRINGKTFNLDEITFCDYSITGLKFKKQKL